VTPRVAIIGAGLAGLIAADRLLARNVEVTLIDMGRRAGGRFCTRSVDLPNGKTATFDIGPQVLYARRPGDALTNSLDRVRFLAQRLSGDAPLLHRMVGRIGAADERAATLPPFGLAIAGGMRELVFRLLATHRSAIDFRDHTRAERLERTNEGWKIHTRSLRDGFETHISANALILTAPIPQSLELLAANQISLPDELARGLRTVRYTRCLAIYGLFAGAGPLPPGGAWIGEGPLEWVVDNRAKGISEVGPAISALTTDAWATENWAESDSAIIERLSPTLRSWVGEPLADPPLAVQRWPWARPLNPLRASCAVIRDQGLVLAGDGFGAMAPDHADGAILSGEAAANRAAALITHLARFDDRLILARPSRYILEIAVSTPDEAIRAATSGADRLELSSGLEVGGLTPSLHTFRAVREAVSIPVYVLIRPRPGGFRYSDREFDVMLHDAEEFLNAGAAGIVFGILCRDGIDRMRCQQLVQIAGGRAVFHRAFDFLPDPLAALDELIELGFERVLTSGLGSTAEAGATQLASLVQHAGWQIEILPAGKIRPENVVDLVRETRCEQVHSSARTAIRDPDLAVSLRLAAGLGVDGSGNWMTTDLDLVASLRSALDQLAHDPEEDDPAAL
jgi:renalase